MIIKAKFLNGVAVPENGVCVPDGTVVAIVVKEERALEPELREDFEFWDQLGADGWEKFLEWERKASA